MTEIVLPERSLQPSAGCAFCCEFRDGRLPEPLAGLAGVSNRIVRDFVEFAVIPSVSPLTNGHVMVVPRVHVTSIKQLPVDVLSRLPEILESTLRISGTNLSDVLIWEHGVGCGRNGGCGVSHAHLHILPIQGAAEIARTLAENWQTSVPCSIADYHEQSSMNNSYLFWQSGHEGWLYESEDIPSQHLRRLIAMRLSLRSWDWKELSRWDVFRETLVQYA
jgi:diadenosine tetraphosphate (Ap4A) HIT family hydrolase